MIFGFNDLPKGVHGLNWVGLREFFLTQPTIVGKIKKKIQPTQSITGVQLNPHGIG